MIRSARDLPLARAFDEIARARRVAISGHTSPDGDALGSALGLMHAVLAAFPDKDVDILLADDAPLPRIYRFLPGSERFLPASAYDLAPDLFVAVDAPTPCRIEHAAAVAERARRSMVIDHHPAAVERFDVAIRSVDAAATAVIIAELVDETPLELTPEVATCLFCGIVTDTGRFQYQNVNPEVLATAARLVAAGADPARISLEVYQSKSLGSIHLEAIVAGRLRQIAGGRVAYSYARAADLDECGVSPDECDGLIDIVRSVEGAEVCLFIREDRGGAVRGNLRAKGAQDVSTVAAELGGGGHVAAAGFTIDGSVSEALDRVLPMLERLVEEA